MSSRARPNVSLYISNLSYSARTDDLRKIFGRYGPLKDVYIPLDYYSRKPRGFAYVQFEDIRDAEDAVYNEHGSMLLGKEMIVDFAQAPRDMRYRTQRRDSRSRSRTPDRSRRSRRSSSGDHYRRSRRRSYSNGSRSYSRSLSRSPREAHHRNHPVPQNKSPLPPLSPHSPAPDTAQKEESSNW